jgi:ubiquinone/menaquinone biosynthesis C-methylase UbiE
MTNYNQINSAQKVSEEDRFTQERYKQFLNYFVKGDNKIIDIGCNTGRGGEIIRKRNEKAKMIGIDIVKSRLMKIKKSAYNVAILASATDLPIRSNTHDVIVGGEFIEHISNEDLNIVIKEFFRVLKNGGRIMLTTPNPNAFIIKIGRDSVIKDPSHLSFMNKEELAAKLRMVGFKIITIKGSGKATRLFGENFFLFNVYGSYLIIAQKFF